MKKISTLLLSLLSCLGLTYGGQAVAQDSFEREFSRFDKDFERLNTWKTDTPASKKLKHVPAPVTQPVDQDAASGTTTPLKDDAHAPAAKSTDDQPVTTDDAAPAKPAKSSSLHQGLPKGAKVEKLARSDLLGSQISDPVMRKKVQDLYKRDDIVVQQYVMPTN